MNRREFLAMKVLAVTAGSLAATSVEAAEPSAAETNHIDAQLSRNVQMQFMRPGQLEAAGRKFPEDQRSFNLKAVSPEHWWMV